MPCAGGDAPTHPDATRDQRPTTTIVLDKIKTNGSSDEVDGIEDDLCLEGWNGHGLEDGRAVVDWAREVVRSSPQHLELEDLQK